MFIFVGLRLYTRHGQTLTVPDLSGLKLEEVNNITEKYSLRFEINDSLYLIDSPKGIVIGQNPKPNTKVKKDRTIFLTLSAFNQVKIAMPDLIGSSFRQATAIMERTGLRAGELIYVPDYARNNVLKQKYGEYEINPGEMIEKGSYIDLVLGDGLSERTTRLPDLTGLTYHAAAQRISSSYLNIGAVLYDPNSVFDYADSLHALVYKQNPTNTNRKRIRLGAMIDIMLKIETNEQDTTQIFDFEQ